MDVGLGAQHLVSYFQAIRLLHIGRFSRWPSLAMSWPVTSGAWAVHPMSQPWGRIRRPLIWLKSGESAGCSSFQMWSRLHPPAMRRGQPDAEHVARLLLALAILPDVARMKRGQVVVQQNIACIIAAHYQHFMGSTGKNKLGRWSAATERHGECLVLLRAKGDVRTMAAQSSDRQMVQEDRSRPCKPSTEVVQVKLTPSNTVDRPNQPLIDPCQPITIWRHLLFSIWK